MAKSMVGKSMCGDGAPVPRSDRRVRATVPDRLARTSDGADRLRPEHAVPAAPGGDTDMAMEYRRLGSTGLKVSVLSFGSWVTFGTQVDTDPGQGLPHRRPRRRRELLRQRRGLRRRRVRADHGPGHRRARVAPLVLRDLHQDLLGHPRRRQHAEHAQPQVPAAGHRRLARAAGPRLRRPPLLPPARPRHADRGDGVGHVRHRRRRARPSTGAPRSGRPTRSAPPGTSPSATTCTSRSWSSRSTTCSSADKVEQEYARLYEDIGLGLTTWSPLAVGPAHRQVRRRRPRGQPGRAARLRVAARPAHRPRPQRPRSRRSPAWPSGSAAPCRSSPSPGAPPTPTCRRVITGASRVEQVHENMGALDVLPELTPEVLAELEDIVR